MKINFNNNSKKLYLEFKTPEGKHEVIIEKSSDRSAIVDYLFRDLTFPLYDDEFDRPDEIKGILISMGVDNKNKLNQIVNYINRM